MTRPLERGEIEVAFSRMRIRHPRVAEVARACNGARVTAREAPYAPKRYVELFADSHTGKSTAITTYIEDAVVSELVAEGLFPKDMPVEEVARRQTRVIHVTLTEKATRKSLYSDILGRLGDERAFKGDLDDRRRRVYSYLADKRVELLILDEIQHLSQGILRQIDGRRTKEIETQGTDVTDALKNMMIKGLVPMVLVGIPEARIHLAVDKQFTNRELDKIDFSPIRWSVDADRAVFLEYCGTLGVLIEDMGLLPETSELLAGEIPHGLWVASGGRMGLVSRIAEEAVYHASRRENATRVEHEDLEKAVDTRAIPNGYCTCNPFRGGPPEAKVVAA